MQAVRCACRDWGHRTAPCSCKNPSMPCAVECFRTGSCKFVMTMTYLFIHSGVRNLAPAYGADEPSSSSIRSSWLYFERRSERQGAPVLIWPVHRPTARSAMYVSSVSPERCDVITPQPAFLESLTAWMASVIEPIWLTLSSSALHALSATARLIFVGW